MALIARCDPAGRIDGALRLLDCQVRSGEDLDLRELASQDVLLVYGGPILTRERFDLPRLGSYNLHPSLLPRFPGRQPEAAVIATRDAESGVTIHRITERVDQGPMVVQRRFALSEDETVESYRAKAMLAIVSALPELIDHLEMGRAHVKKATAP